MSESCKMIMGGVRYANIDIVASMAILVGGTLLFKDAGEGALQAVGLVSFFSAFVIYRGLDERAKRRRRDQ